MIGSLIHHGDPPWPISNILLSLYPLFPYDAHLVETKFKFASKQVKNHSLNEWWPFDMTIPQSFKLLIYVNIPCMNRSHHIDMLWYWS